MGMQHEPGAATERRHVRRPPPLPAQALVAQHLPTYKEFPQRQKPGSFNLDRVLAKLQEASSENK
jgi:hypothetical protein